MNEFLPAVGDFETLLRLTPEQINALFSVDEQTRKDVYLNNREWLKLQTVNVWLFSFQTPAETGVIDVGDNPAKIINKLATYPHWMFHNLSFDGNYILKLLQDFHYRDVPNYAKRPGTYHAAMLGTRIYSIQFTTFDGNSIVINDSLRFIPYSVQEIPQPSFFNYPDLAKGHVDDYDAEWMYRYTTTRDAQYKAQYADYLKYATMDVRIVYRALQDFAAYVRQLPVEVTDDEIQASATLSSLAYKIYQKFNPDMIPYLKLDLDPIVDEILNREGVPSYLENVAPDEVRNILRLSFRRIYKGGFCDVNRDYRVTGLNRRIQQLIHSYDLNSAYPAVMATEVIPISLTPQPDLIPATPIVHVILTQCVRAKTNLHPLFRDAATLDVDAFNHPSGFEAGTDFGLFKPEYEACCRLYTGFETARVYEYPTWGRCIDSGGFVACFYALKKAYKKTNRAFYTLSKLFMNAVTGKFGQRPVFQNEAVFSRCTGTKYRGTVVELGDVMDDSFTVPKRYMMQEGGTKGHNLLMVAYITARTRCKIYAYIEKIGVDNGVYSDTDSIKVLTTLDDPTMIGAELGMGEYEGQFTHCYFFRPKCYGTQEKGWTFGGAKAEYITDLSPDELCDGTVIFPAKLVGLSIHGGIKLFQTGMVFFDGNDN